jgi:hypothetical protein
MSNINFSDKIFVQEALQSFTKKLAPVFGVFANSYSGQTARKGDAIAVPRVDPLTASTFSYDNNSGFPYETSAGTINAITVNLNEHQIVGVDLTDIQFVNSSAASMSNFARQQGKALATRVMNKLFALMTVDTFGAAVTSATIGGLGRIQLSAARKAMVNRGVPTENLSLVTLPDLFETLLNDSNLSQAFQYGGSEVIREANIPRLLGMNVFETTVAPIGASASLVGFLAHPDAMAVAVRQLTPQDNGASYLAVETAIDDETGLGFTYRRHFNPGRGKHFASLECLWGATHALTLGLGLLRRTD